MWKNLLSTAYLLTIIAPLCASVSEPKKELSSPISSYLTLIQDHPKGFGPMGRWKKGEIEIITNVDQIKRIEKQTKLRLMSKGVKEPEAEMWSSVGVVAEDNYWMWVRDAVIFPSGVYGTYDRILWKSGIDGTAKVAILPLLSTKKVVVNVTYRHATRSWEVELPRGSKKSDESLEKAAARELQEETGYLLGKCSLLGNVTPDSGVLMSVVPVFCGEVTHSGETNKEFSEAIIVNPAFSKKELKDGFLHGVIEIPLNGEIIKANCRDPYLAYAIFQAELKGLL